MTAAWCNYHIYKGLACPDFLADYEAVLAGCEGISQLSSQLVQCDESKIVSQLQTIQSALDKCGTTLAELRAYVFGHLAIDGSDLVGQKWQGKINKAQGELDSAASIFKRYLTTCDRKVIDDFLAASDFAANSFQIKRLRQQASVLLTKEAEELLMKLRPTGLDAWGARYMATASAIRVDVEADGKQKAIGPGEAREMLASSCEKKRKSAFAGLNEAWQKEKSQCASILNSILGWRLAEDAQRGSHFLDKSLHLASLSRQSLDACIETVRQHKELGERIFTLQARRLGREFLAPWDWYAPAPLKDGTNSLSFMEAVKLVESSFSTFSPAMGEFVSMMVEQKWIDCRVLENKSAMPFCSYFPRAKEPRVSVPFTGTAKNLQTLAHELGHAYHYWVLRNLPLARRRMPMPIAEAAGIFTQNAMSEVLLEESTGNERLTLLWEMCAQIRTFLFHDLCFFDFEYELYERRAAGPLSGDEVSEMFGKHWRKWFGNHYGPDEDRWLRTVFPFMTGKRFYNYPYAIGFLFALALQDKRKKEKSFSRFYDGLLADSGSMPLEELAHKHLAVDLHKPQFWSTALDFATTIVERFEEAL